MEINDSFAGQVRVRDQIAPIYSKSFAGICSRGFSCICSEMLKVTYANQFKKTKLAMALRMPTMTSKTLTKSAGRRKVFLVFIIPKTTAAYTTMLASDQMIAQTQFPENEGLVVFQGLTLISYFHMKHMYSNMKLKACFRT